MALVGVTAIETTAAGFTVSDAGFELMVPDVAVIEATPETTPVARPLLEPIVAAIVLLELQVTDVVKVCMLPSV